MAPLAVGLAILLLASGCGTRLEKDEAQRQLRTAYGVAGSAGGTEAATAGTGSTTGSSGSGEAGGAQATTGGDAGASSGSGATSSGTGDAGQAGDGTTDGGGGASGAKAPIIIAMNCNCSGVIGAAQSTARDAYQAWVQTVNARGGIDGHAVKLLYADDNNSASQDLQNVKTFVEQGKAIAIVNFFGASGGIVPVAEYAMKQHVAVVGGTGYDPEWTKYPVLFSTATSDEAQDYAWAAEMKDAGKKVVGAIYCTEGDVCANKEATWKKFAQQLGLQVKYESRQSLAAPSFSSDCINARSNGVEALIPILDGASAARVARDCDQQGYHPLIVVPQPFDNPPAYMNGAVAPLGSFPWFLTSGSPALEEYAAAIKRYVRNARNTYSALGWANAKLLEKALTGHVSDTPKAQDVFDGLWALRGETLGGLTAPLNFPANKPAAPIKCSFRAVVKDGKWLAPLGMRLTDCQP